MSGTKRRELKSIFNSFDNSWHTALNQERKEFRENCREIAADVEKSLGLDVDAPIEEKQGFTSCST